MPKPETIAELRALGPTVNAVMDEALRQLNGEERARQARQRPARRVPQTHLALSVQEDDREEGD